MEIKYLQVLVMDNGEILCEGQTIGFISTLGKYLITEDRVIKEVKAKEQYEKQK